MLRAFRRDGDSDDADDGGDGEDETGLHAPRTAFRITLAVLGGCTLITVLNVLEQGPGPARLATLALCLTAVLVLQFAHSTRRRTLPVRVRVSTLSAQAVVTYLPLAWIGWPWAAMVGFLAGSVLLTTSGRLRWPLYGATAAGIVPVAAPAGPVYIGYGIGVTLLTGLIIFGVSSLSDLVAELRDTRRALAGLAVAQERSRVAGDLHDLLGYSLSAIMLKSELGHRLLPAAPGRSRSEVAEVLDIARDALGDVRVVATGYRDMSLSAEAESALSVLDAAGIAAEADLDCGPLPREVDTVLAIVLREAVTNALRHSKAQHCTISAAREGGTVSLRIRNDGVGEDPPAPVADTAVSGGSGLGNLRARLRDIGGGLTGGPAADGWFDVTALAPAEPAAADRPAASGPADPGVVPHGQADQLWMPRTARAVLVAVLAGYSLVTVLNGAREAGSGGAVLAFLGCFAVVATLQALHSLRRPRTWPVRTRALTLGLQAAATYAPLLWLDQPWGSMAGFLAGSLLITVPGRVRWALYAAAVAVAVPPASAAGVPPAYLGYLVQSALLTGLVVYGITALYRLVAELHEARGALARLAVTRERLLVQRELHEVLGSNLSAITLKCELIHRLLPRSPEPARGELATVLDLARRTLADVRRVAGGYRGRAGERDSAARQWPFPEVAEGNAPFVDFPRHGQRGIDGE